jgi:sulfide dehydrogenase cytochrome subunit
MFIFRGCLLAALFTLSSFVSAAELEVLVETCDGCHGPQGVSAHSDVPTIAGQTAKYLGNTLETYQVWGRPCIKSAYRHGDTSRPASNMCAIAESLGEEEIEAVSGYYAAKTFVPAQQEFDAANAVLGAQIHEVLCETCHAGNGKVAGNGPILAGQWAPYLREQLRLALTGEHLVPPMMEKRISEFSPDEIESLMNFYASQQE